MRKALALLALLLSGPALAEAPQRIAMVTWRGCETACAGFIRHFDDRRLAVEITVIDVARDRTRLPAVVADLRADPPDLVVTWGTSVSTGVIGTRAELGPGTKLGDIPALFMIVADPVGSDLVASHAASGRALVTGVRNRVPEAVQLRTILDYFAPRRIGVINDPDEVNSTLNTEALRALSAEMGFDLVALHYAPGPDGRPDPAEIGPRMGELARAGVDAVYVGSSSFNLAHATAFVAAAREHGLPVFSAYESMVRDSGALMAVANHYANVGKLAGRRAERILFGGETPGQMPVIGLERFSLFINMDAAVATRLYPPLQLIQIAEIIGGPGAEAAP